MSYWVVQVIRLGFRLPWCSAKAPLSTCPPTFQPPGNPLALGALDREVNLLLSKGATEEVASPLSPGFYGRISVVPKASGGWRPVLDLSPHLGFSRRSPENCAFMPGPEGLPRRLACTSFLPRVVLAPLSAGPAPVLQLGFLSQRGEIRPQALTVVCVPGHDLRHPAMVTLSCPLPPPPHPLAYSACSLSCLPCFTGTGQQHRSWRLSWAKWSPLLHWCLWAAFTCVSFSASSEIAGFRPVTTGISTSHWANGFRSPPASGARSNHSLRCSYYVSFPPPLHPPGTPVHRCLSGVMGDICGPLTDSGLWLEHMMPYHINLVELEAVFQTLRQFCLSLLGKRVLLHTDNTMVACYINNQRGARSQTLSQ